MPNFAKAPGGLKEPHKPNETNNNRKSVTVDTVEKVADYLEGRCQDPSLMDEATRWKIQDDTGINYYSVNLALEELVRQGRATKTKDGKYTLGVVL